MLAVLSLIVAIIAIIVTLIVYRLQKERRNLNWVLVSGTKLLQDRAPSLQDLELRYKGEIVKDPYLLIVKFENVGNKPIASEDYERPLRISFPPACQVLAAEIVSTSQDDMGTSISVEDRNVVLKPVMLNARDCVTCQILVDRPPKDWRVKGRIKGVEIRSGATTKVQFSPLVKTILFLLIIPAIFGLFAFSFSSTGEKYFPWLDGLILGALGVGMLFTIGAMAYDLFSNR
jgi:hypothetical protein